MPIKRGSINCHDNVSENAIEQTTTPMLETAVEYIAKKCCTETESGTYLIHADDFPDAVLSAETFKEHIGIIADMLLGNEAVAEADVEGETISVILFTDYCSN